jgi:hypothetical protein
MAAAATDKFRKLSRRWVGQIGAGGVADASVTTVPLSSATNLATDTGVTVVIDRVDADGDATPSLEETIVGVVSGSNLVSCVRGVEGTAQAHSAGAVVEVLVTSDGYNDIIDGILVEHDQDGTHDATIVAKLAGTQTFTGVKTFNADPNLATGVNIQVNGVDPYRTITLTPGFLKPATTAPCATSVTVEAGTNDIDYDVLDFDKATDENAFANFQMPESWDGGVVQFRFIWTSAGGSAAETLVFELSGRSFANDDAIDQAVGTPIEVSDALIATGDIHISSWSGDVTLTGAGAGEWVHVEVMRDVSEDTLDADARLIGVQIRYKIAQYSD